MFNFYVQAENLIIKKSELYEIQINEIHFNEIKERDRDKENDDFNDLNKIKLKVKKVN